MLGGNIGNVSDTFSQAIDYLAALGLKILKTSRIGKSAAVDCVPDTPDFCDQAISAEWNGSADGLLTLLQACEKHFGRPQNHRSDESRTLDCDLIFLDQQFLRHSRNL